MTAPVAVVYRLQLAIICSLVAGRDSFSIQEGGLLTEDLKLQKWASPITVKGDVFVHKDVTLTIAAGVVMRFAPGVMLAVNGTLKAEGLPHDRITMTRVEDPSTEPPSWPSDIRLVDDQSVAYGRLQLLYRGRWRGVCANSQNWTQTDTDVACRQLGFLTGNFSFMSWARNDSRFMLYHRPDCTGAESTILGCPRAPNIQIGSRICVQQTTIHLHCYGLAPRSTAAANWWGLEFYNATLRQIISDSIAIYESNSVLRNVDILYAGVDPLGEPVPAVRASPTVPRLDGVAIRYCALDATNFTDINASTIVHNSDFLLNRGHGLVVESRFGRIRVTDSRVIANSGNGIKAKLLDRKYLIIDESKAFCQRVNVGGYQRFPQVISGIPFKRLMTRCDKKFRTMPNHIITFNVLEMDIEPDAKAWLYVYDGKDNTYPLLAKIPVINGTLPQGLSSTKDYMYVMFNWSLQGDCPTLQDCVKFTIMVDSGPDVVPEFFVNNTQVHNNTQHGIFLENVRNKAVVNASSLSFNGYGAGLRVYGGAGNIQVNASNVTYNEDNGVNITYDGGWRVFNQSSFSHNYGNGVNVTLNETSVDNKTRLSMQQRTEVSQSTFLENDGIGFRIGNFCREGNVVVNDSQFISNTGGGIEMESCFRLVTRQDRTNFTIGYNNFESNFGHAVKIAPMLSVIGRIANNTFTGHPRYVLLLDNTDDLTLAREYTKMSVEYDVMGNRFIANRGFYVANLRLTQGSNAQRLDFKFNRFEYNVIDGGGTAMTLNQRTRAHAVVIVSSSNVRFERNALLDPDSQYEVATHLLDQSVTLTASPQWWGTVDYNRIVPKIFDQSNRYNLARIKYHPALKYDRVFEDFTTYDEAPVEVRFDRGARLGGRLYTAFRTERNKRYHVDRDIDVMPEGRLTIEQGTILEFENSIGMLIQGTVKAEGRVRNPVVFRLRNETTAHNNSLVRLGSEEGTMEGRLEVRPSEEVEWGTVCSKGWTIVDASVVCQMLGLVVHPNDWRVYDTVPGPSSQPIWRSRVDCTELDMDVTKCKADGREDHSCTHDQDVHVRCKKPTWAGIRFLAKASPSRIVYATVSEAGLMDPTAILYSSAIMIDYNVHTLEHLTVSYNMGTGIDILHNDIYSNAQLRDSVVSDNEGNGVIVRAPFFTLAFCILRNNVAGFEYNPSRTTYQGLQLRAGIHDPKVFDASLGTIKLANHAYVFVVTKETIESTSHTYTLEVSVESSHRVVMDVLDYNPDTSHENVTVFDGRRSAVDATRTRRWRIEDDMADFPVESSGMSLTIEWTVDGTVSGRFTFVLRSKPWNWDWPFAKLTVMNTTTELNEKGIVTRHYNQPSNEFGDLFHRYRWETIRIYGVSFLRNHRLALHVPSITKYHEQYLPTFEELQKPFTAAEITYELDSCLFKANGGGLLGEHNHVEFSNNMWIWQVTNNVFRENNGGFALELPLINLTYQELYNHSVDINDTIFINNRRFEFRIDGFYCNSTIARNRFVANACLKGCITITGTEKDIDIHDNEIFENTGKYIMELNMKSHTPYTRWVEAEVTHNDFKRNRKPGDAGGSAAPSSSPTSYTLGIKGLQNITINRNLFANSLDYELVGGYASSSLDNYLDVRENWWGTSQQAQIREKIFDFDDWNSYAIAEYYPFLISNHFGSTSSTLGKEEPVLDVDKPLGGRIETSLRLQKRSEPYIIRSDLTIMPRASVYVEPGVELQFYPNVGILVLGSLSMRGYADNIIKVGPIKTSQRQKRASPPATTTPKIRLVGGETEDEGFIQIYNTTERSWVLICDTNFNDETAEVACRTMGRESSNVIVERSRWYDIFVLGYPKMHEQVIEWFWRETLICDGTEDSIDQCRYKVNYNLNRCMERRDYVFVRCGPRNLAAEFDYWGNIRFSTPEYEQGSITAGYSSLDYVDIYGAGMLHGERVAAIQAVHRTPTSNHVRITNCAWNGYDFIAPRDDFLVTHGTIKNNNGYGVGGLVLNGESRYDIPRSSFLPLIQSSIPYNVFGLVRMCTTEKLIYVHDRLLLYYKYAFEAVDCIKIIRSVEPQKRVALRFLQLNLLSDTFHKNAVEMYNGEYFESELKIGEVTAETSHNDRAIMYETRKPFDLMGIRVTASAAHGHYGFIAEVVTLPLSPGWRPDLGPGNRQQVMDTDMTNNLRGGVHFMNVGELNPSVQIERCRVQHGGYKILNNTGPAIIFMYIQNSRLLTISNNYMNNNYGGVFVNTTTTKLAMAIYSNITNNVMMYNSHGCMLHIEGHHFQGVNIRENYFAWNNVSYRNLMSLFGVHLNFSGNIVKSNVARTIINATVPKQVKINQRYTGNTIYDNEAIGGNKTTIFLKSAKFSFNLNFLLNRLNKFEMVTFNRTRYEGDVYPTVDARNNWWGYGLAVFVSGRVMERRDDDYLIGVTYMPFHETNATILQGRCYPGWILHKKKCYRYMGGVAPYHVAEKQCKQARARIAWASEVEDRRYLGEVVTSFQENYDEKWRVWVYSDWETQDSCSSLRNYEVDQVDCELLLSYVCERDPYVSPSVYWRPIIITLVIVGAVLFIVVILIGCAVLKARARKEQHFERRDSLRASLRSSRQSVMTNRSVLLTDDMRLQRARRPPLRSPDHSCFNLSGVTLGASSTDSIDKLKLDAHRPGTPGSTLDYLSTTPNETSSYLDSDLGPSAREYTPRADTSRSRWDYPAPAAADYRQPPRLENEIANIMARPTFDNVLRNDNFRDDRSIDRLPMTTDSPIAVGTPRRYVYPRPSLSRSAGNSLSSLDDRPKPKETAM